MTDAVSRYTVSSRSAAVARSQLATEAAAAQRAAEQARSEQSRAQQTQQAAAQAAQRDNATPPAVVNGQGQRIGTTVNVTV